MKLILTEEEQKGFVKNMKTEFLKETNELIRNGINENFDRFKKLLINEHKKILDIFSKDKCLSNIRVWFEEISVPKRIDAEEYVINKIKRELKIKCIKSKDFRKNITMEELPKNCKSEMVMNIINTRGLPDLVCWMDNSWFMVEVKTGVRDETSDGLRLSQFEWIKNHPNVIVIIFWVKQTIDNELAQMTKGERK